MNILTICYESICIDIAKQIEANKYHFIVCPKKGKFEKTISEIDDKNITSFSHKFVKVGKLFKKIDWNNIKPLSASLIEKMSFCEAETLRMFERIKINPAKYENRKKHYMNHLRFWNDYLDKNKINVFFRFSPPHMGYDNIIYHLCKYKGIQIIMLYQFYLKFAYFMHNDVREPLQTFEAKMIENINKEIKFKYKDVEDLYNYHSEKKMPKVLPMIIPSKSVQKRRSIKHASIINYYKQKCVKKVKYGIPYIFFPLHYQYEATTCPLGGVFVDQDLAIEILNTLDITIYVKDHPRISANRSKGYYNKLVSMKNVKLVDTSESSYKLTDNSLAVATITGTAGWEAILRGKPSIIFGYHFWQYAYGAFRVSCENDARKQIEKIKKYKPDYTKIKAWFKTFEDLLFPDESSKVTVALKKTLKEGGLIE